MPKKKKTASPLLLKSQPLLADLLGVSPRTIDSWRRNGMPGAARAWDVKKIIAWLRTKGPWRPKLPPNPDPLMQSGDSPWLEEYRKERALMARMDREEREGTLLDRQLLHECFSLAAAINRRTGKRLEKEFGKRALEIFTAGFKNADREISQFLGVDE